MNIFAMHKSRLDKNLAGGRWNYARTSRATRIEYAHSSETSGNEKSAIDLIMWGTTIQRWHQNGEVEIMSDYSSITTTQRHKQHGAKHFWTHKKQNFVTLFNDYSANSRKAPSGLYRQIIIPAEPGIIVNPIHLQEWLKTPEAFILNLGMRAGISDACEQFCKRIAEHGYPDFAKALEMWKGKKFGWDRRKVKKELDSLADPHFDACENCEGVGQIREWDASGNRYELKDCDECEATGRIYSHLWLWDFESLSLERPLTYGDVLLKNANPESDEATIDGKRYAIALADGKAAKPSPSDEFIENWLDKLAREEAQKKQMQIPGIS